MWRLKSFEFVNLYHFFTSLESFYNSQSSLITLYLSPLTRALRLNALSFKDELR